MIAIQESYEIFIDTLEYLKPDKLKLSDEDLEYYIFEELDADAHTFFHEWTVDRLINGKLIPQRIKRSYFKIKIKSCRINAL